MDLAGKVALVTGAGRRIGRAIALALGRRGVGVVVHYKSSRDEAEEAAAEIRRLGAEAWTLAADLARPGEIAALLTAVADACGRLDILVNSAASFEARPFLEIGAEDWDRVMAVNLRAPFLCLRHAASLMGASPRPVGEPALGVNLADLSGVHPWRGYAHHGVSKAALLHLTRVAARELAPGVRVNAVVPGAILPPPGMDPDGPDWRGRGAKLPLGRTGEPADVARAVLFLAENDYLTGAVLPVDGGEHLLGPVGH